MVKVGKLFILIGLTFFVSVSPMFAYQIRPEATDNEGKIRTLESTWLSELFDKTAEVAGRFFISPVHERVTHHIFGCEGDEHKCSTPEKLHNFSPDAVLAGVRWNDNPPFELNPGESLKECRGFTIKVPNHFKCWGKLFRDAEKRTKEGAYFDANSGAVFLYRVHFGDMQFLHSMASHDGEEAGVTKDKIMMWAEFAYRLALGEIDRGIELRKIGIPGMEVIFKNRGWSAQQLFTRGDPTFRGEKDFHEFTFGTLLHIIHDSFVPSHTDRDEPSGAKCEGAQEHYKPGKIRSFHSYAKQDKKKHKEMDTQSALDLHLLKTQPNVVDVGKVIKDYYDAKRPWSELKNYLECVFEIEDTSAKASPGELFMPDRKTQ